MENVIGKIVAVIIGLSFLGLQYLAYENIIGTQSIVTDFFVHAPFGAAFIGGFYLGFQKG